MCAIIGRVAKAPGLSAPWAVGSELEAKSEAPYVLASQRRGALQGLRPPKRSEVGTKYRTYRTMSRRAASVLQNRQRDVVFAALTYCPQIAASLTALYSAHRFALERRPEEDDRAMTNERPVKFVKRWGDLCVVLALFLIACTALTTWTQSGGQANATNQKMVLLGNLRNTGNVRAGNAGVTIYINKLATQQDVNEIVEMLRARGPDPVVEKLYSMDNGRFSPIGSVGTNLALIRVLTLPTGVRVIRALASRPETFREMYGTTRSDDYPFGIMEIRLDQDGKGEGVIIVATKITFDKEGMIQMESFNQAGQIQLVNVRLQK